MSISDRPITHRTLSLIAITGFASVWCGQATHAQHLTNPVYRTSDTTVEQRVAQNTPAHQASTLDPFAGQTPEMAGTHLIDQNVRPASAEQGAAPFDLTQLEGEHPLMPCLRVTKGALQHIDTQLQDYTATFTKVERLNGSLGCPQQMQIRVRHQPFSIYMKFVQPKPGQEVLYVENQNDGNLIALASGWKRRIGLLNLDPKGTLAMQDQRYPITKAGIRNLTYEIIQTAEADTKYAECEVTHNHSVKIAGRPVSMLETTHPVPRKNFKYHKSRIFMDHELRVPVAYEAYSWPAEAGGKPVLEERYIYTNIQVNNGFTDTDFSSDNPTMFQ